MEQNLDIIIYSNYFKVDNKTFAFRRKVLFDITNLPTKLGLKDNNNCLGYWINRKWFSLSRIKEMIKVEDLQKDISVLQWFDQAHLHYVFNL